jgi:nucleoside phosphorylase
MALIEREVGAAVAATAMAMSPRARKIVRQGAVYGLAGAIKAGDVVVSTARGAVRGAQHGMTGEQDDGGGASASGPSEPATTSEPTSEPATTSEPETAARRATRARTTRSASSAPAADES